MYPYPAIAELSGIAGSVEHKRSQQEDECADECSETEIFHLA